MLHLLPKIFAAIGALLGAMSCYYTVYAIVGLFATRHFAPAKRRHRYAIVIAARNEEAVIGRLLESIRLQDYPSELLTVFVVADNCTDGTAQAARRGGAVCYERCDPDHRTKGYALEYLFSCIARDYGTDAFEGYFVFDADNLLNRDYVSRMNEAFDAGEHIVTSCRASKNFGDNWISASYALHWLRTVRMEHRARSVFGLATRIQGTGFLFASELVKNGWHYTSLTEARAFTADAVAAGYPISYCDAAVFYDEQPVSLRIALRQRIRWAKGHLQAFAETGWPLWKHVFTSHDAPTAFMSYDMFLRAVEHLHLRRPAAVRPCTVAVHKGELRRGRRGAAGMGRRLRKALAAERGHRTLCLPDGAAAYARPAVVPEALVCRDVPAVRRHRPHQHGHRAVLPCGLEADPARLRRRDRRDADSKNSHLVMRRLFCYSDS